MNAPKMTMMTRPDGRTRRRTLVETVLYGFDLWVGLAVGAVVGFIVGMGLWDGPGRAVLWSFAGLSLTLSVAVWGVERWLADRVSGTDYGELVGIVDPDHGSMLSPYHTISIVAFLAALTATVVGGIGAGLEGVVAGVTYGLATWLLVWAFVGFVELLFITHRHLRRQAEVQSMREAHEAKRRLRNRERNEP